MLFATSPAALVQHPAVRRTLDLDYIAAAAARLAAPGDRTPYADVRMLAAGTTVIISRDGTVSRRHRRELPAFGASIPWVARDKAARELQHRLVTAVARRLPSEPAAVWLSGGVDSPAVLAAGVLGRRRGVHNTELRAVSLSYPEGDVGREDQFIEEIATRLGTRPLWVYTRDVRLLEEQSNAPGNARILWPTCSSPCSGCWPGRRGMPGAASCSMVTGVTRPSRRRSLRAPTHCRPAAGEN